MLKAFFSSMKSRLEFFAGSIAQGILQKGIQKIKNEAG